MILTYPQTILYKNFKPYRDLVQSRSSEFWSGLGCTALFLTWPAGYFSLPYLFAALVIFHCLCDAHDGFVYRDVEQGVANGYGLYIDHMLDAIGALFVALGAIQIAQYPWMVGLTLVLFYLIAIHSWLYKIVQVAAGRRDGLDFWIYLSRNQSEIRIGPDELSLVAALLAITHGNPAVFTVLMAAMMLLLFHRVIRATLEFRKIYWK